MHAIDIYITECRSRDPLPFLSLQANTGVPTNGPVLLPNAAKVWPMPLTVPLVAGCV